MYNICYWSVADSEHGHDKMAVSLIQSARKLGIKENFHVFSDVPIKGATVTHDSGIFDKSHYMFKFDFLLDMKKLMYDYFVFIDADSHFVRSVRPSEIVNRCQGSPVHIVLESNCNDADAIREDWWGCPLPEYCRLMWGKGVRSKNIYNVNAGFWVVHRDAIDTVYRLALEFWNYANDHGYPFTEEAPLAFVAHMLVGDAQDHLLRNDPNFWASDWQGHFTDVLPREEEWTFYDYMTNEPITVNPSIVHAMRSKQRLINDGVSIEQGGLSAVT